MMKMARKSTGLFLPAVVLVTMLAPVTASAGTPQELLRGEAPLLFTGAEGEDANSTLLLDGQPIRGDEIWLWTPAVTAGQVDLGTTGSFFKIWDSGPEAGPDGNDDDDNGMRGMDFNASTGKFLISYEDTTTTGFAFGGIRDGDLMELTATSVSGGFITGHSFNRLFNEGANGTAGNIGTGDINAISSAPDGTLFIGSGGTQTVQTNVPGTLSVSPNTLMHLDPTAASGSPENIGPDKFFEAGLSGVGLTFAPAVYTGQLRGADILDSGEVTFGTSVNYRNTVFSGPIDGLNDAQAGALATGVVDACLKADICSVPNLHDGALNTYQQRTAEVLYAGSLFYQAPNAGDSEILDHDILDTALEIQALINLLGADSPAGQALLPFVPEPATLSLLLCGGLVFGRRRRRA